jgi:hypothetical protein
MDLSTVITSAAVGAVTAAVVNIIGQALERRSRRKELLLAKAVELAVERVRFAFEVAKASSQGAALKDPGITCATYYKWLRHLLDKGELPSDAVHKE